MQMIVFQMGDLHEETEGIGVGVFIGREEEFGVGNWDYLVVFWVEDQQEGFLDFGEVF